MRYLLIKYIQRPNGKIDEEVSISKRLRTRDVQLCAVILDFAKQEVVQCSMRGVTVPKDWNRVLGFYYQYYKATIERLCQENGLVIQGANEKQENNTD